MKRLVFLVFSILMFVALPAEGQHRHVEVGVGGVFPDLEHTEQGPAVIVTISQRVSQGISYYGTVGVVAGEAEIDSLGTSEKDRTFRDFQVPVFLGARFHQPHTTFYIDFGIGWLLGHGHDFGSKTQYNLHSFAVQARAGGYCNIAGHDVGVAGGLHAARISNELYGRGNDIQATLAVSYRFGL